MWLRVHFFFFLTVLTKLEAALVFPASAFSTFEMSNVGSSSFKVSAILCELILFPSVNFHVISSVNSIECLVFFDAIENAFCTV